MYFIFETIYNGKKSGGVCVSKTLAGARIKAMMVHKDNFGTLPCPVDVFVAKITKKEYMDILFLLNIEIIHQNLYHLNKSVYE